MTSNLLVSVLIITYNQELYIEKTLSSICSQKGDFNIEIILGDDCSTDNTFHIVSQFLTRMSDKIIIKSFSHEHNLGMMPNLIFCLRQCRGKYIAFCEGDDYWIDDAKLQKQIDLLDSNKSLSMVITNRSVLRGDDSYIEDYELSSGKTSFDISDIIAGFVPGTQTMMMRNYPDLATYLEQHPEFYYGDRYISYYCSLFGNISLIKDVTAVYRMTGTGVWSSNSQLDKLHRYNQFMKDFHKSLGIPLNNEVLAIRSIDNFYTTLKYCIKRPKYFSKYITGNFISSNWNAFNRMKRIKILLKIIFGN